MHLWAMVFEGDWTVTGYAAYGNRIAWQMSELPQYADRDEPEYQRRWHELDHRVLAGCVSVETTSATFIGDLTATMYQAAKSRGLAASDEAGRDELPIHWDISRVSDVWLASSVTDMRFDADSTVAEAELSDGDLVVLCVNREPPGAYMLGAAGHPERLIRNLQLVTKAQQSTAGPRLWGALLYTDEDVALATYVRTHFDELNALSGPKLGVFVVERPQSWETARSYWRKHLEPPLVRMFSSMRWLSWKPYDRHLCYEVARELGIQPAHLPCLAIFRSGALAETLVFPIEAVDPRYLRRLFGEIERAIDQEPRRYDVEAALEDSRHYDEPRQGNPAEVADRPQELLAAITSAGTGDDPAFDRVAAAHRRILDELRPQPSAAAAPYEFHGYNVFTYHGGARVTENFTFHGQTTFVNRPVNTVIQDFQQTHAPGPEREQLTELLRLALTSTTLSDTQKEQVAQEVHQVTRELAAADSDKEVVKSKLTTIQNIVSKAADIAKPAMTITTKLIELFAS
ncbi:hypothetical protein [Amycolatopsis sp. CA-128772]|uniref:hypothetical protein n=1 Tax=Amycolatopsis sp. CA-128772 TaxID=2073159 RepID=UPI000CD0DFA7|nr:hypothetical protein [Amycolatopsis sp. CA-128772]